MGGSARMGYVSHANGTEFSVLDSELVAVVRRYGGFGVRGP